MTQLSKLTKPLKDIGFITLALTIALSANFAYGQWANPTVAPVSGNVTLPINTSSVDQIKGGALTTRGMLLNNGSLEVYSNTPQVRFTDKTAGQDDWLMYANNSYLFFVNDHNDDGSFADSGRIPLVLNSGDTDANDWGRFGGQVRADTYCDYEGNNCISTASMSSTGGSAQYSGCAAAAAGFTSLKTIPAANHGIVKNLGDGSRTASYQCDDGNWNLLFTDREGGGGGGG